MGLAILGVCLPPLVMGPALADAVRHLLAAFPTAGLYHDEFGVRYLVLPILTLRSLTSPSSHG